MAPVQSRGEVVTFYSYKGGTGRTMALANVACLLAPRVSASERVLVVDWDLEAPGLHRFFPGRLGHAAPAIELGLDSSPGLIDIFTFFHENLPREPATNEEAADRAAASAISKLTLERYLGESGIPHLQILRAGRNDDGEYSKRVNTFSWEGLFRRAPSIYRRFAERLAEQYRYVLIDSRTGVTDISGICTSLLPEKLVVVFTPNRQSLTGVQDLVKRATSYRRASDDLRPLLVYPLPSRIEASLEDLRSHWRFGNRDLNIVGYQPMFESALAEAYGLAKCDLTPYFEEVQIQQTPDYAYGEEIAVSRIGDRFSLGNSYRVFADRLVSGAPPWTQPVEAVAGTDETQIVAPLGEDAEEVTEDSAFGMRAERRTRIFMSYAHGDLQRVRPIARAFEKRGWTVFFDQRTSAGVSLDSAISEALDSADAIVVCWSKASVASEWVRAEAYEGLRRGVLVPVLLDDVAPPLEFRRVQSADLSRQDAGVLQDFVDDVALVARGRAGSPATPIIAPTVVALGPRRRLSYGLVAGAAAAAAVLLAVLAGLFLSRPSASIDQPSVNQGASGPTSAPPPNSSALSTVPNFVDADTNDVRRTADLLKLTLTMRDERGNESSYLDGIVTAQTPAAGTPVDANTRVQLQVATTTVLVPLLVPKTLNQVYGILESSRLRLGQTKSATSNLAPGTITSQSPPPGTRVAAGSAVDVTVASSSRESEPAPASRPVQVGDILVSAAGNLPAKDVADIVNVLERLEGATQARSADRIIDLLHPRATSATKSFFLRLLDTRCVVDITRMQVETVSDARVVRVMATADYACRSSSVPPGSPLRFDFAPGRDGWLILGVVP